MQAGGWDVALLEVGTLPLKAEMLGPEGAFDDPQTVPSNALLLRREGRTVLVDTGAGHLGRLWPGLVDDLDGALAAAGSSTAEVDALVLTHLDFDHCGAAMTDVESPAFTGAMAIVPREAAAAVRERDPGDWNPGRPLVESYGDAGRLVEAAAGDTVVEDVVLRAAPGHREGHSVLDIGGELLYLADVVHHPSHVEHPDWDREFDTDPELGLRTRREVLGEAAGAGVTVAASHIPGFARIVADGSGLRWQPL
jgi:glyoxylase-like metal-dependent hydrolase (beta-lactamase superfamily II)